MGNTDFTGGKGVFSMGNTDFIGGKGVFNGSLFTQSGIGRGPGGFCL